MANEATLTASLRYTNVAGNITTITLPGSVTVNVAGIPYVRQVQNIPTTKTALFLGSIATLGCALLHNADPTNYVELYQDNSAANPCDRLMPGEWTLKRWPPGSVPYAKAHTAAVNLEYFQLSN